MTGVLRQSPSAEHCRRIEKSLKDMLAQTSNSVPLLICLADLYDLQERFADAETVYRQALHKDGDNVMALNNLAWLLAFKQAPARDEALVVINKAIDLVGPSPELLDTRGVVYLMLAQATERLRICRSPLLRRPRRTVPSISPAPWRRPTSPVTPGRPWKKPKNTASRSRNFIPWKNRSANN